MMAEKATVDATPKAPPAQAESGAEPTFKKGDKVRIMRPESFWVQEVGTVVTAPKGKTGERYPITVRFE